MPINSAMGLVWSALIASLLGACLVRGAPVASGPCQDLYRGLSQVAVSRVSRHDHTDGSKNLGSERQSFFPEARLYMRCCFLGGYLLCSSGQLKGEYSGLFTLCFAKIGVALRNRNRDHRCSHIWKSTACVSWLDKDGDHICADHGCTERAIVFHQSCPTSFYRKHADALRHGVSGSLKYRIVKVSLSRVRSSELVVTRA